MTLGIGKLATGAEDYYLGIAAGIEDYYVGIASPGQWIGSWTGGVRVIERFRFENGITSESRAFGKHEGDWQAERHLDAVQREIDPPQRSRGVRR